MPPTQFSAGVVPVRYQAGVPRYLLLRVYRNWDFPKGGLEPGESPLQAACRELREETGLDQPLFRWGEAHRETAPYGRGKVARYYLAEVPAGEVVLGINPELGHPEHHEYRWSEYGAARTLLPERLREVLDWAQQLATGRALPSG